METRTRTEFLTENQPTIQAWVSAINACSGFEEFAGRYDVKRQIGKGKFSEVHLCVHT
ncbi:MAG: hypothetical protein P4M11_03685 [Candidatus Pacebacteria bacterium]|nr:hypothetical protein [Candidatus Paceibacterota bacterium]